jgi:hypothetical protein
MASGARLADVLDAVDKTPKHIYGVVMQVAEFDTSTPDGKKFDGPAQEQRRLFLDTTPAEPWTIRDKPRPAGYSCR